jgi:hypothetical protein
MAKLRRQLALCVENEGYDSSLERGKVYQVLPDKSADGLAMVRVVDESGEDYLFPAECFVVIAEDELESGLSAEAMLRIRKSLRIE